jgi:hypothetical protein
VPGYAQNPYFTTNCDRLTPWPHSNSTIEDRVFIEEYQNNKNEK